MIDKEISMDDIFASWRDKKFVVVDKEVTDTRGHVVVLSDFVYWSDHMNELTSWCNTNGGEIEGMIVYFEQDNDLTAFILRWS